MLSALYSFTLKDTRRRLCELYAAPCDFEYHGLTRGGSGGLRSSCPFFSANGSGSTPARASAATTVIKTMILAGCGALTTSVFWVSRLDSG